jgi:hypothetical protein
MPVTYTNRKGTIYTLCQGVTKSGKPRYSFVRDPEGKRIVETIPKGWEISESVNGVVSLVRERVQKLLPGEVAAVEQAVRRHPKARNYRVNVRSDRIEVYERVGPDLGDLVSGLRELEILVEGRETKLQKVLNDGAQFAPVLQFILEDEESRFYRAERWCYSGGIDGWLFVDTGPVEQMARRMIPTLGTDEFFELF